MERREEIQEKANELYHSHTPYEATIAMAEWADRTMIDRICKWLEKHLYDDAYIFRDNEGTWIDIESVIEDLRTVSEK